MRKTVFAGFACVACGEKILEEHVYMYMEVKDLARSLLSSRRRA